MLETIAERCTDGNVLALGMERREIVVAYNVGDQVKITDGPLATFLGTVEEIEPEKNRVRRDGGRDVKPHDFETELKIYFDP